MEEAVRYLINTDQRRRQRVRWDKNAEQVIGGDSDKEDVTENWAMK